MLPHIAGLDFCAIILGFMEAMKSDDIAYNLLKNLGFHVESIPTSDHNQKKEADFLVSYKGHTAIVESKLKEDNPKISKENEEKLAKGEAAIVEGRHGRNETFSGIIRKADQQLKSSADKHHSFRIVLFICTGSNVKTKKRQFIDTIYGSTTIIEGNTEKICYFYRNSDFYRRRSIDAAIVFYILGMDAGVELCLNPYSAAYESLRKSAFIEPFGNCVVDPFELERKGLAYIPDPDIERTLPELQKIFNFINPILENLTNKYRTGYLMAVDYNSPELSIRTKGSFEGE
jgi:hypothetical protein